MIATIALQIFLFGKKSFNYTKIYFLSHKGFMHLFKIKFKQIQAM